jgi:hypothetical protein
VDADNVALDARHVGPRVGRCKGGSRWGRQVAGLGDASRSEPLPVVRPA